jgi:predicted phage tail protein
MSATKKTKARVSKKPSVMIPVIRITNPFNPREFVKEELTWKASKPLLDYFPAPSVQVVVSINGKIVPTEQYALTYLDKTDNLVVCPVPTGGGDSKSVLSMVAMIAVVAFAPMAAGALTGTMGVSLGAFGTSMVVAGVTMAGSLLVNSLFAPPKASKDTSLAAATSSYGIDGAKNTSVEGLPVPVCYGNFRMGGNIIGLYVENGADDNQILYMLISAGEGQVASISDVEINDTSISDFNDVEVQTRLGLPNQLAIPWFNDTVVAVNKNQQLTQDWYVTQTSAPVDKLRIDFVAPQGIAVISTSTGAVENHAVGLEVQYRAANSSGSWTPIAGLDEITSWTQAYGTYAGPAGSTFDRATSRAYVRESNGNVTYIETPVFAWTTLGGSAITDQGQIDYLNSGDKARAQFRELNDGDPVPTTSYDVLGSYPNYETSTRMFAAKRSVVRKSFATPRLLAGDYDIRARRVTANSTEANILDDVYLSDVNEIILEVMSYPNTALLALKIRMTDQLSSLPKVTYINGGRVVQAYGRPDTGSSQANQWYETPTQNPAWVVWDMLTNRRFGGAMATSRMDFLAFKAWADHCDDIGVQWNGVIDTEMNVWDACQLVLRVGHAQLINVGTRYTVVIEKAASPVMMFSVANMVEGSYRETWLGTVDRANEIDVTFFDKQDGYKQRTIKIYDPASLTSGSKQRSSAITLFGVTDYEIAYREAQLQLNLNRFILKTASFAAPMEAVACTVGDLIYVQHDMTEWAQAGRFAAGSTTSDLTLDRNVMMESGKQYKLLLTHDSVQRGSGSVYNVVGNNLFLTGYSSAVIAKRITIGGRDMRIAGTFNQGSAGLGVIVDDATGISVGAEYVAWDTDVIEEYNVVNDPGETSEIRLQSPSSTAPAQYANWMFGEAEKVKNPFRIKSVSGNQDYTRDIVAVEYKAEVYDFTRYGTNVPIIPPKDGVIGPVRSLQAYEETYVAGSNVVSRLVAAWQRPQVGMYAGADIYVKKNDGPMVKTGEVKLVTSAVVEATKGDKVTIKVVAYDIFGKRCPIETSPQISYTVIGEISGINVGGITGAGFIWSGRDCKITWRYNSTTHSYEFGSEPTGADAGSLDPQFKDYEIRVYSPDRSVLRRTEYTTDNSYTYIYDKNFADGVTRRLLFEVRMRDKFNNLGKPAVLDAYNPPPQIVTVDFTTSFESATLTYTHTDDADFVGAKIWLSRLESDLLETPIYEGFSVYQGPDTAVLLSDLMFDATYYFVIAAYDAFGLTELIPTAVLPFKTTFLNVDAIADDIIGDSKLLPILRESIRLISDDENVNGSVNQRLKALNESIDENIGTAISEEIINRTTATDALVSQLNGVAAVVGENTAGIVDERTVRASETEALAYDITGIRVEIDNNSASITSEALTRITETEALAQSINQLTTELDGNTATIEETTRSVNGIYLEKTVKLDINGRISGYGLIGSEDRTDFIVNADNFAIVTPGTDGIYPFTVGTVNGVVRTVIRNGIIGDASIGTAKIGDAQINTLKLAGAAVTVPLSVQGGQFQGVGMGTYAQINYGRVFLDDRGIVYANIIANQWYGTGLRTSILTLSITDSAGRVYSSAQGGAAVVPSPAVAVSGMCAPGWVTISSTYAGEDAGVRIQASTLFVIGAKR